jgi:cellulose synthase/poly-beta-1,6-N-acetylglucosamine synthase-like glycosyltransferase
MSNYTVSYKILKEVNFFDTGKDYIAEDVHTALKIVNKTSGRVQVKPIYAFSNQTNLASSGSFVKDFLSKFWQSERHQRGMMEFAYTIQNLVENEGWKKKHLWQSVLSTF